MNTKGYICYLVRHTDADIANLVTGLQQLQANYLAQFPCPVHMYHEAGLTKEMQQRILDVGVPLTFHQLQFEIPPKMAYMRDHLLPQQVGYRHMCRFFTNNIFWEPALQDVKYYMRLDTDSFTPKPITYDLFDHMDQHGYKYGYITTEMDAPHYYSGLQSSIAQYLESASVPTLEPISEIEDGRCYYTNFEICEVAWFREEPWVSYFKWIDEDGGIYRQRWGDHIIRYLGLHLFMPQAQIHQFRDVPYLHYRPYNIPGPGPIRR